MRKYSRLVRASAAAAVALALAACSPTGLSGPVSAPPPTFTGIVATSMDHSVAVRDLYIPDPGGAGYPAGISIALAVQVWNNTNAPISLTGATITGGAPASLISPKATTPATTFDLPIGAGTNIGLSPQVGQFLQIQCAARALTAGTDVPMTFTFSNGATIVADVPIGRFPDISAGAAGVATC